METAPRPIIIVTGANSGVGFGICHRLIIQLSQTVPPDAKPQFKTLLPSASPLDSPPTELYDGLTLIMACRSEKKALAARRKLLALLDRHVVAQKRLPDYDGHAERFRENLEINFHQVDMSIAKSVFQFGEEIKSCYPYVSHLICNAGCAFWSGVGKLWAAQVILTKGLSWSITLPPFKLQRTGIMSKDGLGCTWQSNIFGHYIMYRHLQPLFKSYATRFERPARIIWTSSLEGQPCWYDHDDWQGIKSDHSYECTKYEIDLIAARLNQRSLAPGGDSNIVRHFTVHPGIVHSNMTNGMVWFFLDTCKILLFYIARFFFNSPHHPIHSYSSAISATYIALSSLLAIPTSLIAFSHVRSTSKPPSSVWEDSLATMGMYDGGLDSASKAKAAELKGQYVPIKFGTETDRWGREYVGAISVLKWDEHEKEADFLLEQCATLYKSFASQDSSHANGNGTSYGNGKANGHANGYRQGPAANGNGHTNGSA